MTDSNEIRQNFIRDFEELLQRYNADFYRGSGYYGETAEIYFNGIYTEDGETVRDCSDFIMPDQIITSL